MVFRDLGWASRFGERGKQEEDVLKAVWWGGVMHRMLVKKNPILAEGKVCLNKENSSYWRPWQETEKSTFWNKYTLHSVEQNTAVKTHCFRGGKGETESTFFLGVQPGALRPMCPMRVVTEDQGKARNAVDTLWGRSGVWLCRKRKAFADGSSVLWFQKVRPSISLCRPTIPLSWSTFD